jgi:signal transduction histidine kinase
MAGNAVFLGAAAGRRRPLPRNVDEGVRQRLVSALNDLRSADRCLDDEPDRARELIRTALGYANIGPDETRDPITDIYMSVLTTHGLAAAVSALAQVSAMPLTLDVTPARWAQSVEAAAYFLVAETLTIARDQSDTTRMHVAAHGAGPNLVVEVCCDDIIGADATGADRLVGLRLRVEAFDGTLHILRQPGIGTRLRATFPNEDDPSVF